MYIRLDNIFVFDDDFKHILLKIQDDGSVNVYLCVLSLGKSNLRIFSIQIFINVFYKSYKITFFWFFHQLTILHATMKFVDAKNHILYHLPDFLDEDAWY